MIYEYRRVVAFVTLATRRRGQTGRSGGNVAARLNAVFVGAVLTFPAKSSTKPLRPRNRGAKISKLPGEDHERSRCRNRRRHTHFHHRFPAYPSENLGLMNR